MRFTEPELTAALTGTAKQVLVAGSKEHRKAGPDAAWAGLTGHERYQLLSSLGDQILPVLIALPDIEVAVGARPTYSDAQIRAVVEESVAAADGFGDRVRRKAQVLVQVTLIKTALAQVPPRQDPDNPVVPDSL